MSESFPVTLAEGLIVSLWVFSDTKEGCRGLLDSLERVSQSFKGYPEAYALFMFCRDIAFMKGQAMQLLDNQQAFFKTEEDLC